MYFYVIAKARLVEVDCTIYYYIILMDLGWGMVPGPGARQKKNVMYPHH